MAAVKRAVDIDMALVNVERVVGHRTSATIVPRFSALPHTEAFAHRACPPTSSSLADKRVSARSSSARRRAIPDAHAPVFWGVRASRVEPAYFVVTRRQKSASTRSSSARRRAIPDAHAPRVSDGTRTRDILDHNQVLYQLSYTHHAGAPNKSAGHTAQREVYRPAPSRG